MSAQEIRDDVVPAHVLELYRRVKLTEDADGEPDHVDLVTALDVWFAEHGIDLARPASYYRADVVSAAYD